MAIHKGSDKLIVFGTYAAPAQGSTGWGTFTSCKILPFETSNAINRTINTEDLKYKAGLSTIIGADSTVTETVLNDITYEISGSTYVNQGALAADSYAVSVDQLRSMADSGAIKTIAIFSRPASITTPATPSADAFVALWGEPDIVMDSIISSFSETEEVATNVKCDITFKQSGAIKHKKTTAWS